jgi:hypothetical protein
MKIAKIQTIIQHRTIRLLLLLVADFALFSTTNAQKTASFVLIIGFILLAITIYQLVYVLLSALKWYGIEVKRKRRLAAYITGLSGGVIALQSMGELNWRDIVVLLPLVALGYLYSFYLANSRDERV